MLVIIIVSVIVVAFIAMMFFNARTEADVGNNKKVDYDAQFVVNRLMSSKNVKIENGIMEYSIVGESKYQNIIKEVVGEHSERGAHKIIDVIIKAEPENPYDGHAIVVQIGGKTVGYIAKSDTGWFHTLLKKSKDQEVSCKAEIRGGGHNAKGIRLLFGVFLQIPLQ